MRMKIDGLRNYASRNSIWEKMKLQDISTWPDFSSGTSTMKGLKNLQKYLKGKLLLITRAPFSRVVIAVRDQAYRVYVSDNSYPSALMDPCDSSMPWPWPSLSLSS